MLLLSTGIVYSQGTGKELKGIVKTNDGRFLEKVTVLVKGTSTGTVTDSYGRFFLKLQQSTANVTLCFYHTG
jgi:hypothetical protein